MGVTQGEGEGQKRGRNVKRKRQKESRVVVCDGGRSCFLRLLLLLPLLPLLLLCLRLLQMLYSLHSSHPDYSAAYITVMCYPRSGTEFCWADISGVGTKCGEEEEAVEWVVVGAY